MTTVASPAERTQGSFGHVETWVFDLDNTLYPADCNLFAEVDRRMGTFIARFLGVPYDYARHLQKTYYRQFGTTLSGLMQVHNMPPEPFLDYVHDIDLSVVPEQPQLAAALGGLPGRKLIFTNGTRRHAERVAGKLGVLHMFEDICDIAALAYVPKPHAAAYMAFMQTYAVAARAAAMFEDIPHNLVEPHALGMTTVLVQACADAFPAGHESQSSIARLAHVHHVTQDLCAFIATIGAARSGTDVSQS